MSKSDAGKGDFPRPVDVEKYRINYDAIYNPPKCSSCKQPCKQWLVGHDKFYCTNRKCEKFCEVFDRNK